MKQIVQGVFSFIALAVIAGIGVQVSGIGGIAPRVVEAVKNAISRGASPGEIAHIARDHGFDVMR